MPSLRFGPWSLALLAAFVASCFSGSARVQPLAQRVAAELAASPFLVSQGMRLAVVREERGWVTVGVVQGPPAIREAIELGVDILRDDEFLRSRPAGERHAIIALRRTVDAVGALAGVKTVSLTTERDRRFDERPMTEARPEAPQAARPQAAKPAAAPVAFENLEDAVAAYRKAAADGDPKAQHALASLHIRGHGVSQDLGEAIRWYRRAALSGYVPALNDLAWILATAPDPAVRNGSEAVALASRAVAKSPRSSNYLATLAAAQARGGNFAAAFATQRRALETLELEGRPRAERELASANGLRRLWSYDAEEALVDPAIPRASDALLQKLATAPPGPRRF